MLLSSSETPCSLFENLPKAHHTRWFEIDIINIDETANRNNFVEIVHGVLIGIVEIAIDASNNDLPSLFLTFSKPATCS
jgi:hypothetical protein